MAGRIAPFQTNVACVTNLNRTYNEETTTMNRIVLLLIFLALSGIATAQEIRIDVAKIAGGSKDEVAAAIGSPMSCRSSKYGETCLYALAETEIVFINGRADWITIEGLDDVPFGQNALRVIGLAPKTPSSKNNFLMKWEPYESFLSVSLFKGGDNSDYAYIKVRTK